MITLCKYALLSKYNILSGITCKAVRLNIVIQLKLKRSSSADYQFTREQCSELGREDNLSVAAHEFSQISNPVFFYTTRTL